MKLRSFVFLLSLFLTDNLIANVAPRYKAHLFLKYFVVNGDSALKSGKYELTVSFYEESELTTVCKSKEGDIAVKVIGRPVWRDGMISHRFGSKFYFRKANTDRWEKIFDRLVSKWNYDPTNIDSLYLESQSSTNSDYGSFAQSFNIRVELLAPNYQVIEDSNFVSTFIFEPTKIRIDGKNIKLKTKRFEIKGKPRAHFIIGSANGFPITISYVIYEGTANRDTEFETKVLCSYYDKKKGSMAQMDLSTDYVNVNDPDYRTSLQCYNDDHSESIFCEYDLAVNRIFN